MILESKEYRPKVLNNVNQKGQTLLISFLSSSLLLVLFFLLIIFVFSSTSKLYFTHFCYFKFSSCRIQSSASYLSYYSFSPYLSYFLLTLLFLIFTKSLLFFLFLLFFQFLLLLINAFHLLPNLIIFPILLKSPSYDWKYDEIGKQMKCINKK